MTSRIFLEGDVRFEFDSNWIVKALVNRDRKLPVVLWIDEDKPISAVEASALAKEIERRLRPWLTAEVLITNLILSGPDRNPIPGLSVSSLI